MDELNIDEFIKAEGYFMLNQLRKRQLRYVRQRYRAIPYLKTDKPLDENKQGEKSSPLVPPDHMASVNQLDGDIYQPVDKIYPKSSIAEQGSGAEDLNKTLFTDQSLHNFGTDTDHSVSDNEFSLHDDNKENVKLQAPSETNDELSSGDFSKDQINRRKGNQSNCNSKSQDTKHKKGDRGATVLSESNETMRNEFEDFLDKKSNEGSFSQIPWDDFSTSKEYNVTDRSHMEERASEKVASSDFLSKVGNGRVDSIPINVATEMGVPHRLGNSITREDLRTLRDVSLLTPLETFREDQISLYENFIDGTLHILPKRRSLVLAEPGTRSSCLYESLSEWLAEGKLQVVSLADYYRQWFLFNGQDCVNRKLTHTIGGKRDTPRLLRNIINTEIANNAKDFFTTYADLLVGEEGYRDWMHLQEEARKDADNDSMGGRAQLIMFSVMFQTPVIVWEHMNDTECKMRYTMNTNGIKGKQPDKSDKQNGLNPSNTIVHLLYSPRSTAAMSHYDVVVVFDLQEK